MTATTVLDILPRRPRPITALEPSPAASPLTLLCAWAMPPTTCRSRYSHPTKWAKTRTKRCQTGREFTVGKAVHPPPMEAGVG